MTQTGRSSGFGDYFKRTIARALESQRPYIRRFARHELSLSSSHFIKTALVLPAGLMISVVEARTVPSGVSERASPSLKKCCVIPPKVSGERGSLAFGLWK